MCALFYSPSYNKSEFILNIYMYVALLSFVIAWYEILYTFQFPNLEVIILKWIADGFVHFNQIYMY